MLRAAVEQFIDKTDKEIQVKKLPKVVYLTGTKNYLGKYGDFSCVTVSLHFIWNCMWAHENSRYNTLYSVWYQNRNLEHLKKGLFSLIVIFRFRIGRHIKFFFFFIIFALGGSPTPHPISSRPHFVCKFSRHGSSSPVTMQSPGPKLYGIGIPLLRWCI